ncbi:MAG TPA: hypothetical protein VFQ65_16855 [Kofleriaceae bacterium]|nr:hypothetical protein [Kofleriaceae bacterium]
MRAVVFLLISACATTSTSPEGGPRGLRASDDMYEAHIHDKLARHRFTGQEENGAPWASHWDTGSENEEAAAVHRSHAAALRDAYEQACKGRTPAQASISPLERHGVGGTVTANAVVFYLEASAGPGDRLLADLECHRAWMMLAPEADDADPLDLPGLAIDTTGDLDGITVSIKARDAETLPELQRRAAHLIGRHPPQGSRR